MKKLVTLAVLAAAAGGAYAQSSVTLFGIVDEGARFVKNGSERQYSLASGGLNTSRIGFRGVEDLGGGLKAGFWLEGGLDASRGSSDNGGRLFGRRSTVSLIGRFGEIRLGRDYTPSYLGWQEYDIYGDSGIGSSSNFDSNFRSGRQTGKRADNQITYLTPGNLGGVYARLSVAAAEVASGNQVGGRYIGGRVGYGAGPLDASVFYGTTRVTPLLGTTDNSFATYGAGASYDFGFVKAEAYYRQNKLASVKEQTASVGAIVPIGLGQVKVGYTRSNTSGTGPNIFAGGAPSIRENNQLNLSGNNADALAVGYVYNLSKRTALYGTAAYIKNRKLANFSIDSGYANTPGSNSRGAEAGIRHIF